MNYKDWMTWYHDLDAVQQRALDHYTATGDLRVVAFFWHRLPTCLDWPLPESLETLWQTWYDALTKTQQLSVNAYIRVGNPRLLLFVWSNLLDKAQESPEISIS